MELTTLGAVKNWMFTQASGATAPNTDDQLLTRLIAQCSGAVRNYIERPILTRTTWAELRNGAGNQIMMLRNWPVLKINSLTIDGATINAATSSTGAGYTLQTWDGSSAGIPQNLSLVGYCFTRAQNNVAINYDAGYCVTNEAHNVPTNYSIKLTPAYGMWCEDDGITDANTGATLTAITSGTPTTGQYLITPDLAGGSGAATYLFAAADVGRAVLFNYSFVPAALEEAVIELVAERYSYRQRIGQKSMSVGGQTTAAYNLNAFPDWIAKNLDQYKKFLPF